MSHIFYASFHMVHAERNMKIYEASTWGYHEQTTILMIKIIRGGIKSIEVRVVGCHKALNTRPRFFSEAMDTIQTTRCLQPTQWLPIIKLAAKIQSKKNWRREGREAPYHEPSKWREASRPPETAAGHHHGFGALQPHHHRSTCWQQQLRENVGCISMLCNWPGKHNHGWN